MATRSNIIYKVSDTCYKVIYCHWDGYLSNNGRILLEHYQDKNKIEKLFSLGDLSSLGEEIGEEHRFDVHIDGVCTFYGRDRNQQDAKASQYGSLLEALKECDNDFTYYFNGNEWYFCSRHETEFQPLTKEVCRS